MFHTTLPLTLMVDSHLLVRVDEGFGLRDDDSQDQLTSWTNSGESLLLLRSSLEDSPSGSSGWVGLGSLATWWMFCEGFYGTSCGRWETQDTVQGTNPSSGQRLPSSKQRVIVVSLHQALIWQGWCKWQ